MGYFNLALYEHGHGELFQLIRDRNLQQQFFVLQTVVRLGLSPVEPKFTLERLFALHYVSAIFLDDEPGQFRTMDVHIEASIHVPPHFADVRQLTLDYLSDITNRYVQADPFDLAAYALWRLTWIHPFKDCNGRTARAFSYYVLCLKLGYWPKGDETILSLMSEKREEAYNLLAECDAKFRIDGKSDISSLSSF